MDILNKLQIFVPVEAEVTTVPLDALPRSVQRRIRRQWPRHGGSGGPSPPPDVTWICPVVLRTRGPPAAGSAPEKLSSALRSRVGALQAPVQMSIVCPNRAAYNLLLTMAPRGLSPPDPPGAPPAAIPPGRRAAVVLYRGVIYLSVNRRHLRARLAPPVGLTSSSDVSSTSQREEALGESRSEAAGAQQEVWSRCSEAEGTSRGPPIGPGAAAASSSSSSSSPQSVYQALAQQEKIAQMKARLQQKQAAVNKL